MKKPNNSFELLGLIREWIGSGVEAVTLSVSDRVVNPINRTLSLVAFCGQHG